MKLLTLFLTVLIKIDSLQRYPQVTSWESLTSQYRAFRTLSLEVLGKTSQNPSHVQRAFQSNKVQPQLPPHIRFPCKVNRTRSKTPPKSVHMLRPGDIDVIASIGDSLTCGSGLMATDLLQLVIENRGVAFSGGGYKTWREFVTLPNILREFNPKLKGFALGDSYSHLKDISRLNVAEIGAMSGDMPYMANFLVKRIMEDASINIKQEWKMISIMIGANDFCSMLCYQKDPEKYILEHKEEMRKVLRTFRDHLPRTFVNFIIPPNLYVLTQMSEENEPQICHYTHLTECPCLFGPIFKQEREHMKDLMNKWQAADLEVCKEKEFDREDFTVVPQVFASTIDVPKSEDGYTDYSYLSEDCFHLSQKMNALVATSLWNNLIEPVGKKSHGRPNNVFAIKCPAKNRPYLFTNRNSNQL